VPHHKRLLKTKDFPSENSRSPGNGAKTRGSWANPRPASNTKRLFTCEFHVI
jgi:hypothetical protein